MKKIIFILYLILSSLTVVFSASTGLSLSINFYDKQIYYPESTVKIKVTVANNSGAAFSFNSAEIHSYNFLLSVKTLKNIPLSASEKYIIDHNKNKPVFYRQITLMPGEEYSFITTLDNYTTILKPGIYVIKGTFFPDFTQLESSAKLTSNILTLAVRPSVSVSVLNAIIDQNTHEILKKAAFPPDEVVSYFLTARQKGDWNKFFLYLDIESLIQNQPRLEAKFRNSSESERITLIKDYKDSLRNQTVDNDILLVPSSFSIIQTSYTPLKGKVLVRETFKYRTYSEIKEYTYYLHRIDGIWTIYNYEIRNLGTE